MVRCIVSHDCRQSHGHVMTRGMIHVTRSTGGSGGAGMTPLPGLDMVTRLDLICLLLSQVTYDAPEESMIMYLITWVERSTWTLLDYSLSYIAVTCYANWVVPRWGSI